MFGRSKPVVFNPYGSRRSRRRVPSWLVFLAIGMLAGAAAVLLVQQKVLPPRLSAAESTALRADFAQADQERTRLRAELADTAKRLDAALGERKSMADELAASRLAVERLRADVSALADALPADPRGGPVQVRAARFTAEGGKLTYDVVLSRERASKPINGVLQLVVAGAKGKAATSVKLSPVAITMGPVESVRGDLPLPEGFDARQATIQVLDRPDGRLLGKRVINVK